jgi:hypothetical protein
LVTTKQKSAYFTAETLLLIIKAREKEPAGSGLQQQSKRGDRKNLLRKKRRGRMARQGERLAEKEHSFLPVTRAQYCAYFTSDKIDIMMNLSGGHHPHRRYRRHLL